MVRGWEDQHYRNVLRQKPRTCTNKLQLRTQQIAQKQLGRKEFRWGEKQKTTQTASPKLDYIDATLEEILFSIPSAIGIIFGLSRGRHDLASSRAL